MADIVDIGETGYLEERQAEENWQALGQRYTVQELKEAAIQYADHYGIPRDLMLAISGMSPTGIPWPRIPIAAPVG